MRTMWKVFEEDRLPRFLFHGVAGSKLVPLDEWLTAEVKWRREGSNPHYWTAFHCYPSLASVAAWRHRTRRSAGRVVVEIAVRDVIKKPTRGEAYLARQMMITRDQWSARRPLESVGS